MKNQLGDKEYKDSKFNLKFRITYSLRWRTNFRRAGANRTPTKEMIRYSSLQSLRSERSERSCAELRGAARSCVLRAAAGHHGRPARLAEKPGVGGAVVHGLRARRREGSGHALQGATEWNPHGF